MLQAASRVPHSATYPRGFFEFLSLVPRQGHRIGSHELGEAGLRRFNAALRALSPESPALTLNQMASAAQRALERYPDGREPAFVASRRAALERVQAMLDDPGWEAEAHLRVRLQTVRSYASDPQALIPNELPVVGRLDEAVLIDVLLQLERDELADYAAFCRFRKVAADFAGIPVADSGIGRRQWLEALEQAQGSERHSFGEDRHRYAPDPRITLFHVT